MIVRAPEEAQERRHDLIVVGGGIYGCMLALEAARRGLRPLLLERDDFGQHTSGSWLRILHGGLRYLQTLDLPRHVESVRERRWFLRHFPDLVEPLRCVMPLYGRGLRRRWVMAGALGANDLLSWYRNRRVRPDRRLPAGATLSSEAVRRLAPSVRSDGLRGGALWYDAVARRPERLLMEVLRWAVAEGAMAANRVEVRGLRRMDGRVAGVTAVDRVSGRELAFGASVVVNCAGPWSGELAATLDPSAPEIFRPSLAFNVLLDRVPDFEGALAVEAPRPGARTHFVYPAHGRVLAGTFHAPSDGAADGGPSRAMIDAFRAELHEAMPGLALGSAEILHVFSGALPVRTTGSVDLSRRAAVHVHDRGGEPGALVSVSGVKFTTARRVALRVLSELERSGRLRLEDPSTHDRPDVEPVPDATALRGAPPDTIRDAARRIATREAAISADDVLYRRTEWGLDPDASSDLQSLVAEAVRGQRATDGGKEPL